MDMALTEITLVIFTTITPAGVVGFALLALAILWCKDEVMAKRLSNFLIIPLTLSVVGFVCSATHLGTPANALYVIMGIGHSPLSNEVASAVCFLSIAGMTWMMSFGHYQRSKLVDAALIACALTGFICIYFISMAYSVSTIPTWSLPTAPLTLWMNAIMSGPLVVLFVYLWANVTPSRLMVKILGGVSLGAIVGNVVLLMMEYHLLGDINTVAAQAHNLVPAMPFAIALFAVLALAGNVVSVFTVTHRAFALLAKRERLMIYGTLGVFLALVACFVVRFMFYSMYMTWGL